MSSGLRVNPTVVAGAFVDRVAAVCDRLPDRGAGPGPGNEIIASSKILRGRTAPRAGINGLLVDRLTTI